MGHFQTIPLSFVPQDEVLSITEKVVLRLEDLLTWLTEDADWNYGLGALWCKGDKTATPTSLNSLNSCSNIDFADVEREKESLGKVNSLYSLYLNKNLARMRSEDGKS